MNNMKDDPVGLNYLGFLSTPPTSGRAEQQQLSNRNFGGCTTRRSLSTKPPQTTFNGIYEGDFTMMPTNEPPMTEIVLKSQRFKQQHQQQQPNIKSHFIGDSLELSLEQQDDHYDDEVDEEIRGKTFEGVYTQTNAMNAIVLKQRSSLWDEYKSYIFTKDQCERIELKIEMMKKNSVFRKIMFAVRFVTVITIWILHVLLRGILMPLFDFVCATLRGRSILRSSTRRLLWYMTLAKCGDLQLYGLIVVLSPLLFLSAFMGFVVTLYCEMKNGMFSFISYVRFRLDVEPPKFD